MAHLPDIALALSAFLVAVIFPGPNMMAILSTSLTHGRRSGRAIATGVAAGSLSWGILATAGLSAILATYASALVIIKIAGGLYLGFLAFKSLRRAITPEAAAELDNAPDQTSRRHFLRGYLIMMTNPKAILGWIAIVSLGLSESSPLWVPITIVALAATMSLIIHNFYAVAFSTRQVLVVYRKVQRQFDAVVGALFGGAAFKLLTSRT